MRVTMLIAGLAALLLAGCSSGAGDGTAGGPATDTSALGEPGSPTRGVPATPEPGEPATPAPGVSATAAPGAPVTAAPGEAATATPVTAKPASEVPAADRQVVALWNVYGGFAGDAGWKTDPPALVVYGGGLAVAKAERRLSLTRAELAALVSALRKDLAGRPPTASPTGGAQIADGRTTVLGVRVGGGLRTVTAYALEEARSDHGYSASLYHASDLLSALADRVNRQGHRFTSARVRLTAQPRPGQSGKRWPAAIPQPPASKDGVYTADLSGSRAAELRHLVPNPAQPRSWPIYHDRHDRPYAITWRYLLPSE